MGALNRLVAGSALAFAGPALGQSVAAWNPQIAEASVRFGLPAAWIAQVMRAESGGRTMRGGRPIVSPKGAMGLMQLMPVTWAAMRARLELGADPFDPRDNILAGSLYLRMMYDCFGYPGLFAAYNAGPTRYAARLAGGRRLPAETEAYLAGIARDASTPPSTAGVPARPSLFVVLRTHGRAADLDDHSTTGLFAILDHR